MAAVSRLAIECRWPRGLSRPVPPCRRRISTRRPTARPMSINFRAVRTNPALIYGGRSRLPVLQGVLISLGCSRRHPAGIRHRPFFIAGRLARTPASCPRPGGVRRSLTQAPRIVDMGELTQGMGSHCRGAKRTARSATSANLKLFEGTRLSNTRWRPRKPQAAMHHGSADPSQRLAAEERGWDSVRPQWTSGLGRSKRAVARLLQQSRTAETINRASF